MQVAVRAGISVNIWFDKGHRVVGIDISQKCIDFATSYNPQMDFNVMDMKHTNFKNELV